MIWYDLLLVCLLFFNIFLKSSDLNRNKSVLDLPYTMWRIIVFTIFYISLVATRNGQKNDPRNNGDLALWIDEKQVKMFSGEYNLKYNYLQCT